MKTKVDEIDVTDLVISIDRNSEINSELLSNSRIIASSYQEVSEELKRSAKTFLDNQNPSAILGTKKFTSGILIGCAIGLLFTVITGVLSYNYALKLKYDDYKAKVFTEQAKIEQDYKAKLADLDKQIAFATNKNTQLQESIDGLKKFKDLKKADQLNLAYMFSRPSAYEFFSNIDGDKKLFDFVSENVTYIKNSNLFLIKVDKYQYKDIFVGNDGTKYYGFEPKE